MEIIIKTKNHGVVRRKLNCIKEFVLIGITQKIPLNSDSVRTYYYN